MPQEKKKLICITCPAGCQLELIVDGSTIIESAGNACKRGLEYAAHELSNPRRMVTTSVKVSGGSHPLVPVYTEAAIPKPRIFELLAELRGLEVAAPVERGQTILENALGTGVNVVASRNVAAIGMKP
jgi:CxxC motif-containing protein